MSLETKHNRVILEELENSISYMKSHVEAAKKTSRASNEFRLGQVKTGKLALSLLSNLKETVEKLNSKTIEKDDGEAIKNEQFDENVKKMMVDVNKYDVLEV